MGRRTRTHRAARRGAPPVRRRRRRRAHRRRPSCSAAFPSPTASARSPSSPPSTTRARPIGCAKPPVIASGRPKTARACSGSMNAASSAVVLAMNVHQPVAASWRASSMNVSRPVADRHLRAAVLRRHPEPEQPGVGEAVDEVARERAVLLDLLRAGPQLAGEGAGRCRAVMRSRRAVMRRSLAPSVVRSRCGRARGASWRRLRRRWRRV